MGGLRLFVSKELTAQRGASAFVAPNQAFWIAAFEGAPSPARLRVFRKWSQDPALLLAQHTRIPYEKFDPAIRAVADHLSNHHPLTGIHSAPASPPALLPRGFFPADDVRLDKVTAAWNPIRHASRFRLYPQSQEKQIRGSASSIESRTDSRNCPPIYFWKGQSRMGVTQQCSILYP